MTGKKKKWKRKKKEKKKIRKNHPLFTHWTRNVTVSLDSGLPSYLCADSSVQASYHYTGKDSCHQQKNGS